MIDLTRYIGIPYVIGGRSFEGTDCWGLVWLFYQHELGIELPRYQGAADSAELLEVAQIMHEIEETSGFWEPVKPGEEQIGDVLDVTIMGVLHAGIFVPERRMLHAMWKTASTIEDLRRLQWRKRVRGCYRRVP